VPGDDLMRFIGPPPSPSSWWLLLVAMLVAVVAAWCVAVMVWTLPAQRLRRLPVVGAVHARLVRRLFLRSVDQTTRALHGRVLAPAQAAAAYGRAVRSFLFLRTGIRAQYLHQADLGSGELAAAVPLLDRIHAAQFDADRAAEVPELGRAAEELIRTWT
jgi:hypothetical protein